MRRARFGLGAALALSACTHGRVLERPDKVPVVAAPAHDRCEQFLGARSLFLQCAEAKQQAVDYIHKLNTGDAVCVEGGFGEEPREGCKARGFIVDADGQGFAVELRDARLDSRWKDQNQKTVYFENGALVDLYLRERGYE